MMKSKPVRYRRTRDERKERERERDEAEREASLRRFLSFESDRGRRGLINQLINLPFLFVFRLFQKRVFGKRGMSFLRKPPYFYIFRI